MFFLKLTKTTLFVLIIDAAFKLIFWIQICDEKCRGDNEATMDSHNDRKI